MSDARTRSIEAGANYLDETLTALEGFRTGVRAAEVSRKQPKTEGASATDCGLPDVVLIRGDSVMPKPFRWLWEGYLAAGKFHVLAGQPGTGKTTIALDFAAVVSSGGRWPDNTGAEAGNVLIWSGEDDAEDVLAPRLRATGGRHVAHLFRW